MQPNIYFLYVNVLETFIILILRPDSKLGLQVGSYEPTAGELGKEREMVEGLGTSLGTQPRLGDGLL